MSIKKRMHVHAASAHSRSSIGSNFFFFLPAIASPALKVGCSWIAAFPEVLGSAAVLSGACKGLVLADSSTIVRNSYTNIYYK